MSRHIKNIGIACVNATIFELKNLNNVQSYFFLQSDFNIIQKIHR